MKKYIILAISVCAVIFTLWFMHFGELTTNSGALSKTGLIHPIYFTIWGLLTYTALYANIIFLYNKQFPKAKLPYLSAGIALIGMILTLSCKFDFSLKLQYYLHCAGSLTFSIITGICVFALYLLNFRKSFTYKIVTIITGSILVADGILLLIFKQNALIEAVPIIFALIAMPLTIFKEKDKAYAAQ